MRKTECPDDDFAFGEEPARTGAIAQVHLTPTYEAEPTESTVSTRVESERVHMDEALIRALTKVDYARDDAVRRIAVAHMAVKARSMEANEQCLLVAALRAARGSPVGARNRPYRVRGRRVGSVVCHELCDYDRRR